MANMANAEQVRRDVSLIIGGNFTSDSIGLEKFEATIARMRAEPDAYLDAFDRVIAEFPAPLVADLRPATLLDLLALVASKRVRESARRLADRLEEPSEEHAFAPSDPTAESEPEEADRARIRREQRLRELRRLAEGP